MDLIKCAVAACLAAALLALPGTTVHAAEPTLAVVKKRGQLVCGVNGELPGFSIMNDKKEWTGFDVEYCRAIAAAVLGDAKKVRFVPLSALKRFDALKAGEVDVLVRNSTVTYDRAVASGVRFAAVNFIDGQAFVVAKSLGINALEGLAERDVCLTSGTTHELNLKASLAASRLRLTPRLFPTQEAMYAAFFSGKCAAVSQDSIALTAAVVASGKAADYMMLPDVISKEPLGPFVRSGDEAWLDVVRWVHNALIEAEEREIMQYNVEERRRSFLEINRRLLGLEPGFGKPLGLDDAWAYNVIKQVGNYGEIYERNIGGGSPLKLKRGLNALWNKGGTLYPLPMR